MYFNENLKYEVDVYAVTLNSAEVKVQILVLKYCKVKVKSIIQFKYSTVKNTKKKKKRT